MIFKIYASIIDFKKLNSKRMNQHAQLMNRSNDVGLDYGSYEHKRSSGVQNNLKTNLYTIQNRQSVLNNRAIGEKVSLGQLTQNRRNSLANIKNCIGKNQLSLTLDHKTINASTSLKQYKTNRQFGIKLNKKYLQQLNNSMDSLLMINF